MPELSETERTLGLLRGEEQAVCLDCGYIGVESEFEIFDGYARDCPECHGEEVASFTKLKSYRYLANKFGDESGEFIPGTWSETFMPEYKKLKPFIERCLD